MKEFTEKKTTEVRWLLVWYFDRFDLLKDGAFAQPIYHEYSLPSGCFAAFKDEIRAKREMGPGEMIGPTGYVRFEMRDGDAVAVRDDGRLVTRLSETDNNYPEQVKKDWKPVWDKLRAFYEREVSQGWTVEWDSASRVVCVKHERGYYYLFDGAPWTLNTEKEIPTPIREQAEKLRRENKPPQCGEDEFIATNGIVWTCAFRDGVPMIKAESGWIEPTNPHNKSALAAWVEKQNAKWRVVDWEDGAILLVPKDDRLIKVSHERELDNIPNLPPGIKAKATEEIRKHRPLEGDETRGKATGINAHDERLREIAQDTTDDELMSQCIAIWFNDFGDVDKEMRNIINHVLAWERARADTAWRPINTLPDDDPELLVEVCDMRHPRGSSGYLAVKAYCFNSAAWTHWRPHVPPKGGK